MPLPPDHPTPRGNNLHPRGRKNTASLNYLGPSRRTGVLRLPELLWGANLKGRDPRGGVECGLEVHGNFPTSAQNPKPPLTCLALD